ncbi:MAG TPA: helix-turn-helix domain-containing protein [Streptosporangiaceae bacterium]|nr:helix-turn-helix domain-containing protein [Streptosporangiaceae bacterium]
MNERLMVVVAYDEAQSLDICCVTSALDSANWGAHPPYRVRLATPGGRAITCTDGLTMQGHVSLERLTGPLDTLIVAGGMGHARAAANPRIVGHVRRLANESRRVASVCTGAAVLAAAGLLDGRRAATHWMWVDKIAAEYPKVTFDPGPIYIREGNVATSAGVTSALDLTLSFIEEDHGPELARGVAQMLVTYLQRPGNQAQMSMFVAAGPPDHGVVRRITDHIASNLAGDLTTAALAALAGVSERHLTRLFLEHLRQTPGRYVRQVRTEAAAHLLATTSRPIASVAKRCGFGSAETLRLAFVDRYGIPPSRYRAVHLRLAG